MRALTVWRSDLSGADRDHNLAGTPLAVYDNAGASAVLSASLTGQSLVSEQRLLPADAALPDWGTAPPPETESPLVTTAAYDAAGAPLSQTNAAGVVTATAYDVTGAVSRVTLTAGGTGHAL